MKTGQRVTVTAEDGDTPPVVGEVVLINRGNPPGHAFIVVRVETAAAGDDGEVAV